jgi:hypothetical protein
MGRITAAGPGVSGGYLHGVAGGPLAVGSAAWQEWVATPGSETRAFRFPAAAGEWHRAYREGRASGPGRTDERPYWYVKCRVGRTIRRFDLGAPGAVDSARLAAVAAAIAAARQTATSDAAEGRSRTRRGRHAGEQGT